MKFKYLALCASVFLLFNCKKETELQVNSSDFVIGYWSEPEMVDTLWRYKRVSGLSENAYTLALKEDFTVSERKNVGWCGTPPISYGNYDGTWKRKDSVIRISVGYWGGTADFEWKIISVNDKYLTVYKVKEDYHWENRN